MNTCYLGMDFESLLSRWMGDGKGWVYVGIAHCLHDGGSM